MNSPRVGSATVIIDTLLAALLILLCLGHSVLNALRNEKTPKLVSICPICPEAATTRLLITVGGVIERLR